MREQVAVQVLDFYKSLPFNCRESVEEQGKAIKNRQLIDVYPPLPGLLEKAERVLEVGCGCGWMSNSINYHYDVDVTGIDFNPVAIQRASEVRDAISLGTKFNVADLFGYRPESDPFDLVLSLGVLHHTGDCHGAVRHVCSELVRPGGHCLIGLYHTYGRKPFLEHFEKMKTKGASDEVMFREYGKLHSQIKDETLLRSWYRDQVVHPHETQHTQVEMNELLEEVGMELVASSINRFEPIDSDVSWDTLEKKYEAVGMDFLKNKKYFPGFFVFLARKR